MAKPLFPKSVRKYVRFQKARIRREVSDSLIQRERIHKLLEGLAAQYAKKEEVPRKAALKNKKQEPAATAKEK